METVRHTKNEFLKTIEQTIEDHRMVCQGDRILAAVSGGPDSIALVLCLLSFKEKFNVTLGIAHVNHMLRADDAMRDEQFVKAFAKQAGLTFFKRQVDVNAMAAQHGWSVEEAGREARYQFFNQLSDEHGFTKIATGHTKDDNAELVLMNLLRGSGSKGLCGIPAHRENTFIRPLIRATKQQIIDFLQDRHQAFMTDKSNTDMTYLRNKIRCDLLPRLQSDYNPSVTEALDRLSRILTVEEDYMACQAEDAFSNCLIRTRKRVRSKVTLSKKGLLALHPAILSRVLRKGIFMVKGDLKRISHDHMTDIMHFCFQSSPGKSLDLPGRVRIYKAKDEVTIKKEALPLRHLGKQEKDRRKKAGQDRVNAHGGSP